MADEHHTSFCNSYLPTVGFGAFVRLPLWLWFGWTPTVDLITKLHTCSGQSVYVDIVRCMWRGPRFLTQDDMLRVGKPAVQMLRRGEWGVESIHLRGTPYRMSKPPDPMYLRYGFSFVRYISIITVLVCTAKVNAPIA